MCALRSSFVLLSALALLVTACASDGSSPGSRNSVFNSVFGADLAARQPRQSASDEAGGSGASREVVYLGSGASGGAASNDTATSYDPGEYSLNFQNADLREVVQSVLGEALKLNYSIDPKVSGTVTISSARPLNDEDLLTVLESVLKMNGAALVREGDGYKVVEQTAAVAGWADFGDAGPGFGISVLPLRHVSARTVISLIDGFAAPAGTVRAEAARNLLIVLGTSADRKAAIETALSFDQDWMEDQAVAIVPLRNTKPEVLIPELERIFKTGQGDIGADVVQFIPMSRLKAVLVVAAQRGMIERATEWVQRLDSEDADLNARVYVYRVKYRDAQKLAALVNQLFASGSTASADSAGAQIEPDAAAIVTEGGVADVDLVAQPADGVISTGFSSGVAGAPEVETRIQADPSNNSIVIYADTETRQEILAALSHIDVPQLQVAINVTMAEVRLTDQLRYGVQFFLDNNEGSFSLFGGTATAIGQAAPGFNFLLGSQSNPDVIITAFDEITDVQILSSPSLVVVENETAKFQVGDQVPITTRSVTPVESGTAPVSNEIEYRDTGIILTVKPRISENGLVQLEIEQEISAVAGGAALTPVITNRKVSSSIAVVDGQTVLLGGLISDQTDRGRSGLPGLSRLFGQKSQGNNRIELIIMIRPTVIRDGQDAQHVAEELRGRMWNVERSGGK
jgi:general secretion pathway protein D